MLLYYARSDRLDDEELLVRQNAFIDTYSDCVDKVDNLPPPTDVLVHMLEGLDVSDEDKEYYEEVIFYFDLE